MSKSLSENQFLRERAAILLEEHLQNQMLVPREQEKLEGLKAEPGTEAWEKFPIRQKS